MVPTPWSNSPEAKKARAEKAQRESTKKAPQENHDGENKVPQDSQSQNQDPFVPTDVRPPHPGEGYFPGRYTSMHYSHHPSKSGAQPLNSQSNSGVQGKPSSSHTPSYFGTSGGQSFPHSPSPPHSSSGSSSHSSSWDRNSQGSGSNGGGHDGRSSPDGGSSRQDGGPPDRDGGPPRRDEGPPDRGGDGGSGGSRNPFPLLSLKVKPDKKDYPILKTDDQYADWRYQFLTVLHAHNMQVVMRDDFYPENDEQKHTLRQIKYWVYMVLLDVVKTFQGRAIVRRHKYDYDATLVLIDLHSFYSHSTAGLITSADILEWLTCKVLDSSWTKPINEFLCVWTEKAMQYNDMVSSEQRLHPSALKAMLKRAVHPNPVLRRVSNDDQMTIARGLPPLTLDQYYHLLSAAAITQDSTGRSRRSTHMSQRRLSTNSMRVESGSHDDDSFDYDRDNDDDNDDSHSLSIHRTDTRPRLPDDLFSGLSSDDRKAWIGLSQEAKQQIINRFAPSNSAPRSTPTSRQRVNTVDQTEFNSDQQDSGSIDSSATTVVQANTSSSSQSTNSSSATAVNNVVSDAHPGDVRRVLSQKSASKQKQKKKTATSTISSHHVGLSVRDDSTNGDNGPGCDDPHNTPLYSDNAEGRQAWRCDLQRFTSNAPAPSANATSAYNALSTIAADYYRHDSDDSHSEDDDSSDDEPWYTVNNSYYDSLDF